MNELALFAGAGGGILGGKLLGWRTVCAVEWEPYPASVLCARQNDKILAPFPIWDDVRTFDGSPWRGIVDVVSGGFPCQDISAAGGGRESPAVNQDSGLKWQGLLGKYDHATRSWKTAQCSLLEDLEQCLEIWPRWGLMRDGVSYQQQTLVRHISEKESGLLLNFPTPTVMDSTLSCKGKAGAKGKHSVQLSHLATSGALITDNHWETQDKLREMGMLSAAEKRQRFPTITATANQLAPSMQSRYANPIFPTPLATGGTERSGERAGTGGLDFMARTNKWPTPTLRDYKGMQGAGAQERKGNPTDTLPNVIGGRLNPTWVEWLMGWPLEWTDLKPLETDKCQEWQQQHSNF